MNHELTIRFFRNSRNAKKLENYLQSFTRCFDLAENLDKPSHIYITKDSTIDDMKLFNYFWGIVRKYKETSMLADGRLLTKEQAEAILSWIRCYCNCEYFPDQKDYCCISPGLKSLHGWGCKWLCSIIRHKNFSMHNGIQWYKIGPFDGTVQYIDKQDIKDKLVEESKAKCLQLCPLFSLQKAPCPILNDNRIIDRYPRRGRSVAQLNVNILNETMIHITRNVKGQRPYTVL